IAAHAAGQPVLIGASGGVIGNSCRRGHNMTYWKDPLTKEERIEFEARLAEQNKPAEAAFNAAAITLGACITIATGGVGLLLVGPIALGIYGSKRGWWK